MMYILNRIDTKRLLSYGMRYMESLALLLNLTDLRWLGVVEDREKMIGCMVSQSVGVSLALTKYDSI